MDSTQHLVWLIVYFNVPLLLFLSETNCSLSTHPLTLKSNLNNELIPTDKYLAYGFFLNVGPFLKKITRVLTLILSTEAHFLVLFRNPIRIPS